MALKKITRADLDEILNPILLLMMGLWAAVLVIPWLPLNVLRITESTGAPNAWWAYRVLGSHYIILMAIGVFFLFSYLVDRPHGLKILGNWVIFLIVSNNMFTLGYYIATGTLQLTYWAELLPLGLLVGVLMRGRSRTVGIINVVLYTAVIGIYLWAWLVVGFPTTSGIGPGTFNDSEYVNLIEMGYWSTSSIIMGLLVWISRNL